MKSLCVFLLAVLLFGCGATVNFTSSSVKTFPAYTGDVAILDELPAEYQDVGWVSADAMPQVPSSDLLMMARSKAALNGANAIIFTDDSFKVISPSGSRSILCRAIIYEK